MDLSDDSVAILNFTVSSRYYGMLRGQTSMYSPPKHSINSFFKVAAPSPKRSIGSVATRHSRCGSVAN